MELVTHLPQANFDPSYAVLQDLSQASAQLEMHGIFAVNFLISMRHILWDAYDCACRDDTPIHLKAAAGNNTLHCGELEEYNLSDSLIIAALNCALAFLSF